MLELNLVRENILLITHTKQNLSTFFKKALILYLSEKQQFYDSILWRRFKTDKLQAWHFVSHETYQLCQIWREFFKAFVNVLAVSGPLNHYEKKSLIKRRATVGMLLLSF